MKNSRVAIVGAGVAGLAAAMELAHAGFDVQVFERAAVPGGKVREVGRGRERMDAGPTVFTLPAVFEHLFEACGTSFSGAVRLQRAELLARHAWSGGGRLDLFADLERSVQSVSEFAGGAEAQSFSRFAAQARAVYQTLERSFIGASRPSVFDLVRRASIGGLLHIQPFATLGETLAKQFRDPRLRQLFGRYATYCGSSPFASPATLMLIAHVEQLGVWYIDGGMFRLAQAMAKVAERHGARFHYGAEIRRIVVERARVTAVETADGSRFPADAVVSNADNRALQTGLFGRDVCAAVPAASAAQRSLSAITWNFRARTSGLAPAHHTVLFQSGNEACGYRAEFEDIFTQGALPRAPTLYVCAQDRIDDSTPAEPDERLMCLVNAPAIGDVHEFTAQEINACESSVSTLLTACGLDIQHTSAPVVTTPNDFAAMFPATGGALYGPVSHGWKASFTRPGSRSAVPGLYLAGGSTHPGAGVPMAAISGRLAAQCIREYCASTPKYRRAATAGGTSML